MRLLSTVEITEESPAEVAACPGLAHEAPTDGPPTRNGERERPGTGRSDDRHGSADARASEAARSGGAR
jgi:hypothetical protein